MYFRFQYFSDPSHKNMTLTLLITLTIFCLDHNSLRSMVIPTFFKGSPFLTIIYVLRENEKNLLIKSLNSLFQAPLNFAFRAFRSAV